MARSVDDAPLTTRAARERLAARHQPYWRGIEGGAALGYRKGTRAGVWLVRLADPIAGGGYRQAALGRADDVVKAGADDVVKAGGKAPLDYRQAEKQARDWIAQRQRINAGLEAEPEAAPARPYTVADAMADYLTDYAARGGKGVMETRNAVSAHILPKLGGLTIGRLTREKIKTWHAGLAASPARVRGKSGKIAYRREADTDPDMPRRRRATANRVLTVLKAALNHARAEGKISGPADAWTAVKAFREADKPKIRYLLDDEITRLMNACPPDFRALVTGALLTGCRYGELAGMKAGDFDPQAGTVTIPRSKSGRPRHVVLTDEGRDFFTRQTAGRAGSTHVFERDVQTRQATKHAERETRRGSWNRAHQFRPLQEACTAARIAPAISFHVLRHTYASRLAMRGAPMPVIAAQLGHSDTRMTERHYAHLGPSYVADTIRATFGNLGVVPTDTAVVPMQRAG